MKKVAVTGLGVICPLGDQVAAVWKAMLEGQTGVDKLKLIDPAPYRVKIGGEIKHRDRIEAFEKEHPGQYERAAVLSILAAQEALENSKLKNNDLEKTAPAVFLAPPWGKYSWPKRCRS
jgi:3-oxoacyl-[acyl-carrier-protein] synthase II